MRMNSLRMASVIALLVNAISWGLAPPPSVASAPVTDYDPASIGALPAWFSASRDDQVADQTTYTDGTGQYRFEGLPHGTHKVTLDQTTLPPALQPAEGETVPVLWITPGQEQVSDAISTGVRFTAAYDWEGNIITGVVFLDQDSDGRPDLSEPGLPGVRVIDPTLHQYFVPFDDRDLWTLFEDKASCHNPNHLACGPLLSFVHLTASSDGTTYYYDHWEDGYDTDPLIPGPTTEAGVLDAGAHQLFESVIDPTALPWPPPAPPYYYDGRDRITIFGEPATVVRLARPSSYSTSGSCPGGAGTSGWLASAWEVSEVAEWGTNYVATVGEDLDFSSGAPDDHDYTGLQVTAWQDGTEVYYDGVYIGAPLDAGQTYFMPGANNGPAPGGVDSDHTVTATKPIQVQMMTGACSTAPAAYVSAHGYTLQPVGRWGRSYWAPVPGFTRSCNPDNTNVDTDIYLHNPHPYAITVTVSSDQDPVDVGIPANTSISVLLETGWDDISSGNVGAHLFSSETFWGMAVIDSSTNGATAADDWDWGYSLLPESKLSSHALICYGPGNGNDPPSDNGNLAFVAAITDTTIYVDLNQDGLPDPVDLNGDGDRLDYNVFGVEGWDEPTSALGIDLGAEQVLRVGDPQDNDLTGALIYTLSLEEKIAVAWGQDPCAARYLSPYVDLGYTVLPPPIPSLSKVDDLAIDADLTGSISPGDTITYTLLLYNNGKGAMSNVVLTDPIPYTYTDFVVGSIQVTTPPPVGDIEFSDDGINFTASENADIQAFRITWPRIEPDQMVTTTFRVELRTDIPVDIDEISNQAMVDSSETDPRESEDPDDPPDPDTDTPVMRPLLSINKRAVPPIVQPGGFITYTLVVSNYGNGVALLTALTDVLPSGVEYIPGTLDITWPTAQVEVTARTVTETQSFHGYYADDFDLSPTETTGYAGDDGSLPWSTDWTEVGDDGDPGDGEVRVLTDGNALSEPAHVWMQNTDDDDSGIQRVMDLSEFQAPWLRYHVLGNTNAADDLYRVEVGLAEFEDQYDGEYTVQEIDVSATAGDSAVTLGLLATAGLDAGDFYRFDHIAIYETEPLREVTRTLTSESTVLSYTRSVDGDPASYNPLTGLMVITEGMRLPAGGFITATFQVQVQSPMTDGLTLANTACTTSSNWLEVLSPPCDDAAVLVQSSHELTITKTAEPPVVGIGGLLTYTLNYAIAGNEAVKSMVVRDTTPVDTTFYAATPTVTLVSAPAVGEIGPVIWEVSGLWPPGSGITQATGSLTMVVLLDSDLVSGTVIYNAVAISDTTELTDTDEITTPVQTVADLGIRKTHEPEPVMPGEFLTYTLEVINYGPNEAENVVVTDTLPPEVNFVSADPTQTSGPPNPLVWDNLGTLAAGETRLLTIVVTVSLGVDETFTNTASTGSDTTDTNPDNNDDDDPASPPQPGLELVKTVEPYHAARGMPFTYRLRISNTGDFPFTALRVEDRLDDRGDFYYIVGSGNPTDPDTIALPDLIWSDLVPSIGGPLEPGESVTVSYQVTTTAVNDTYTNTATVEGVYEGGTLTDTDDAVVVVADPAVEVDKRVVWVDRDEVAPNYVTFTIVITNVGPSTIDVLPLLDTYDTNYLGFAEAAPYPEEDADDGLLTWFDLTGPAPHGFGRNLPPGQAFAVTTVFLIVRDVFATTNTAIVTGATDIYSNPADEVQDDETIRDAPTPVELLYFQAVAEEAAVRLEWKTGAEVDCVGFYLYRAADATFSHAEAIVYQAAKGGNSTYNHVDRDVTPGEVYWYWLAEIGTDGSETLHGPVWGGVDLDALPLRVYLPLIERRW